MSTGVDEYVRVSKFMYRKTYISDSFVAPKLSFGGPLRIGISDVHKVSENQVVVSGKVESGEVEKDDKVYIMPSVTHTTINC